VAALIGPALVGPALAQTPAADWRTITTPHFRVHYPREYEAWTQRAVAHIESIRDAVAQETGYSAAQRTDVLVVNPYAEPNGATLPLIDSPRIILFTEPPDPEDQVGEYGDWIDLLITHEMTHLEHLLRPSRNPELRLIEKLLLSIGPITWSAPRWATEGYATVIEGRLTGSGRPSSTLRAAILRKWAQTGRLPSYDDLEENHSFLGMSMAYLVGSAYLEWLEERSGAGSLQKLWRRMSARQRRSFDASFEGVFGDSPERLYGKFIAELTERAVSVDRENAADLREGTLWQETESASGNPAVSPDGKSLAVVLRNQEHRSKLVVLSTEAPTEEEKKENERIEKMLKRDPEDVAPVRAKPVRRKPLHTLRMPLGGDITTPRWMPDGASILFAHHSVDRKGDLHHDLYRWTVASGAVDRITYGGDVYDADPLPDGQRFVAVRSRLGFSQLVTVSAGVISPLTEPSLDVVYSHPRVSKDGARIAYASHSSGAWRLVVREVANGAERVIVTEGNVATPEWMGDNIVATVMSGGFIDLVQFSGAATPSGGTAITRTSGGAFEPAPSPDGRLFFMSLERDGYTMRVLDRVEPAPPRTALTRSLVPALPPARSTPAIFASQPIPPSRAYGLGHQELGWIFSGNSAPSAHNTEVGVRSGDVVGRFDAVAMASFGNHDSPRGGSIAVAYRGLPVEIDAQAFREREPLLDQHGLELRGVWQGETETSHIAIEAGALARHPSSLGFFSARGRMRQTDSSEAIELSAESHHARAWARGEMKIAGIRFGAEGQRDQGSVTVGGVAPSILPRSAFANRIIDPALETATLAGRNYSGGRVDATWSSFTFFLQQHRLGERIDVKGVELRGQMPATPILKLPALGLSIGGARVERRNRFWVSVRIEP
jgi:Tol biopolymer transport system component